MQVYVDVLEVKPSALKCHKKPLIFLCHPSSHCSQAICSPYRAHNHRTHIGDIEIIIDTPYEERKANVSEKETRKLQGLCQHTVGSPVQLVLPDWQIVWNLGANIKVIR